jgi:signal peptidase I
MMACVSDALHFIHVIEELLSGGHSVRFRAPGWSMHPTIRNGEIITVVPIGESPIQVGDIVLYRRGRAAVAHRVIRVQSASGRSGAFVLRGDAALSCDRPIQLAQVLGRVMAIERDGRGVRLDHMRSGWPGVFRYMLRVAAAVRMSAARIVYRTHHKGT